MGCIALTGAMAGCFSLEALSSYSDGFGVAGGATAEPPDASGGASGGASNRADGGPAAARDAGMTAGADGEPALDPSSVERETPAAAEPCDGPDEFAGLVESTCYRLIDTATSWIDARTECRAWGGDLAEITAPEENELLAEAAPGSVWIGANDLQDEGEMSWSGGELVEYATWAPGQPDDFQGQEDCVERRVPDGLWNDTPCDGSKPALCERSN